jgi:hypothetical protein
MNIHITKNGQQMGPYTLAQAQQLVAAGTLEAADWAWYEGIADWIPLQQVPGFASPPVRGSVLIPVVPPAAAASPQAPSPVGRPVLVWVICLFYFIFIPLGIISLVASPYLLAFSAQIQEKAIANLQTQVDNTTDPAQKDNLISLQNRLRENAAQVARLTSHSIGYYVFVGLAMLVKLAAAILLFMLRRIALYAFITAFVISIVSTIYYYATMGFPHLGAVPEALGIAIGIFAAIIGWGISLAILYYVWHLSRKGVLR